MMMYEKPIVEVIVLEMEDIVCASGAGTGTGGSTNSTLIDGGYGDTP